MWKTILVFGMGLLLFASPHSTADDTEKAVEKELTKLQGLYGSYGNNFSHQDGGEVIAQPTLKLFYTHRIQGNKWFAVHAKGKPTDEGAVITLDLASTPHKIQLTFTQKGEKGKPDVQVKRFGIYQAGDKGLAAVHWGGFNNDGSTKAAPKQFLELGKPIKGVDGQAHHFQPVKE